MDETRFCLLATVIAGDPVASKLSIVSRSAHSDKLEYSETVIQARSGGHSLCALSRGGNNVSRNYRQQHLPGT